MTIETGFGSPVGPSTGEAGVGSPVTAAALVGETGAGSPIAYIEDAPALPMTVRGAYQTSAAFQRYGWSADYSEDGGALVEVQAVWPTKGPLTAWLRNAAGTLIPEGGCYSGVPMQGSTLYTNESQEFVRFAFPRCPVGTYDLVVQWDTGGTYLDNAVRSVPRAVPAFTTRVLRYAGVGLWLERQ